MAVPASVTGALVFGLSRIQALVILFIVVPIVLAIIIVPVMVRVLSRGPRPMLTSELLASGTPARGRIVRVRSLGSILDARPMVRFDLEVLAEPSSEPFDLQVVQSFPRSMVSAFRPGDIVRLRLSPDRSTGAIEWGPQAPTA